MGSPYEKPAELLAQPDDMCIYKARDCYCYYRDKRSDGFTCNACVNNLLEDKNRLVSQNNELRAKLQERSLPAKTVDSKSSEERAALSAPAEG